MKHTIKSLFLSLGACLLLSGVVAAPVYAADCPDNTAKQTAFKFNGKNTCVGFNDMLIELMKFMSALVGILVVGGITVGGIVYSTGSGNAAKTQKGVTIIVNSVIGLVMYLLMFALINFLVPGGVLK